jgi:hypothetical protein
MLNELEGKANDDELKQQLARKHLPRGTAAGR